MENSIARKKEFIFPVLFTELVGTMLLMLAVNLAGDDIFVVSLAFFSLIVSTYELSGGHLNPCVSIGVYMKSKAYTGNALYLVGFMIAQVAGALLSLVFGYMLRVRVKDEETGKDYLEPNVYASPPPILITTDGMPSYGQIMLSETIGTFILVIVSLQARSYISQSPQANIIPAALVMGVALATV